MRLYEISSKSVVVMFAYSNPPTKDYKEYYKELIRRSANSKHVVYLNPSVDKDVNPMAFIDNLKYNKKVFPNINFSDKKESNILTILKELSEEYTDVVVLVKKEDKNIYTKFHNDAEKMGIVNYSVEVIPTQHDYNDDARKAVRDNDYDAFVNCFSISNKNILSQLYITLRKLMAVGTPVSESKTHARKTHPLIAEINDKTSGIDILESLLVKDNLGNSLYKSTTLNYNIVEVKGITEARYGYDKVNKLNTLFVPELTAEYIFENSYNLSKLLETTTSSNVASVATMIGEPIRRVDSVSHIVKKVDKEDDKWTAAMREFINKHGYITSDIIKKLREDI